MDCLRVKRVLAVPCCHWGVLYRIAILRWCRRRGNARTEYELASVRPVRLCLQNMAGLLVSPRTYPQLYADMLCTGVHPVDWLCARICCYVHG